VEAYQLLRSRAPEVVAEVTTVDAAKKQLLLQLISLILKFLSPLVKILPKKKVFL
jgi:hypothetical protein